MLVILTQIEMEIAAMVGVRRRAESRANGRKDNQWSRLDPWEMDIEGAAADLAYCKARSLYWPATVGSFKNADVGKRIQIRHSKIDNAHLIISDRDKEDHWFVLVTGVAPKYRVCGWILGRDGKKPEFLKDQTECGSRYWIPQNQLNKFPEEKNKCQTS